MNNMQLTAEGPREWTVDWGTDCIEIGYVRSTTTPGWHLVRVWQIRLSWPPIKCVLNQFMTPEMFIEMFKEELKSAVTEGKG